MTAFLRLTTIAAAANRFGWTPLLDRPLAEFAAALAVDARGRDSVVALSRGTCPTVRSLVESPLATNDLRRTAGSAGEAQVATALAAWLTQQAGGTSAPSLAPRAAAAPVRAAPVAATAGGGLDPLRPGTTLKELNAWAGSDPYRLLVRKLTVGELGLPSNTPIAEKGYVPGYTSLSDVLIRYSGPNANYGLASAQVLAVTRELFDLAADATAVAARETAERRVRPPLADPELERLRLQLLDLHDREAARGGARPARFLRQRVQLVNEHRLACIEDPLAQTFCRQHHGDTTLLQFDDEGVRPNETGDACAKTCLLLLPAIAAVLDLLHSPKIARELKQFAHVLATPAWQLALESVDVVLKAHVGVAADRDPLGWRLTNLRDSWDIEPVWVGTDRKGAPKLKKASLKELRAQPHLCPTTADLRVAEVLQPDPRAAVNLWSTPNATRIVGEALHALCGHPRVFDKETGQPISVRSIAPRLTLAAGAGGAEWRVEVGPDKYKPLVLLDKLRQGARHVIRCTEADVQVTPVPDALRSLLTALGAVDKLPPAAMPALLQRLPQLGQIVSISVPDSVRGRKVAASSRPVLRLDALPDGGVTVQPLVRPLPGGLLLRPGVGTPEVHGLVDDKPVWTQRNLEAETVAAAALWRQAGVPMPGSRDPGVVADLAEALQFTGEDALDLIGWLADHEDAAEVLWTRVRKVTRAAQAADLRVQVLDKQDWFGLRGLVTVDGAQVDLNAVLDVVRNRKRYVRVSGDLWLKLSDDLRLSLQKTADAALLGKDGALLSPLQVDALEGIAKELQGSQRWQKALARMRAANETDVTVPADLRATLRPYQVDGYAWLARLATWSPGALLADDMGLGKTLQALALLLKRQHDGPALVVAPTSVESNWLREATTFAPGLTVRAWRHGDRQTAAVGQGEVVVVSYDLLVRDIDTLATVKWATVVLDEAQNVKNSTTQRWKAVNRLDAAFRLGLSGTPVENHIGELWAVLAATVTGLLGPWQAFHDRFGAAIERDAVPESRAALGRILRPFLLRRLKTEVATELPPRIEIRVDVEPSAAERTLYEQVRLATLQEIEADTAGPAQQKRFRVLAAITRLRQLACHPRLFDEASPLPSAKLEHAVDLLTELRAEGHRALVFSQFVRHLALVRERLDAMGVPYRYLDGTTPERKRRAEVDAFQAGEGDVFLISLKAGGTGLNLTGADYVIHLDPWWNPAVEDQATDRAHRIGQTRPVTVYRLVARGTLEEAILELHARKRDLVAGLLGGTGEAGQISTEELMALLNEARPLGAQAAPVQAAPVQAMPGRVKTGAPRQAPTLKLAPELQPGPGPEPLSRGEKRIASIPRQRAGHGATQERPTCPEPDPEPRQAPALLPEKLVRRRPQPLASPPPFAERAVGALHKRLQDEVDAGTLSPNSAAVYQVALRRFAQWLADGHATADADDFLRAIDACVADSRTGLGGLRKSLGPTLGALRGRWLKLAAEGMAG